MTADVPETWSELLDQSEYWIDQQKRPHRIADMDPEYCRRVLGWLHNRAEGIVGAILDAMRTTPLPDVHTEAYNSVAFDPEPERMTDDPHAWMVETELVFALRIQAGTLTPVPARITMALDARDLYGPKVYKALGVEEPTVDMWEAGNLVPTPRQIRRLAELTGFPVAYFYRPIQGDPNVAFACTRSGRTRAYRPIELNPPPPPQEALW